MNILTRKISIHAPPRGATGALGLDCLYQAEFQFTPLREGRREPRQGLLRAASYFNSRPSARGDGRKEQGRRCRTHFNSRPSARGDVIKNLEDAIASIFQFTPLREGRPIGFMRWDGE